MHVILYVHTFLRAWQGPLDLYLGLWSVPLCTVPTAFIYFCTYESLKGKLEQRGLPSAVAHLVPACAGAILSAAVRVPGDTLKHRVQAYQYPNIFAVSFLPPAVGAAALSSRVVVVCCISATAQKSCWAVRHLVLCTF